MMLYCVEYYVYVYEKNQKNVIKVLPFSVT
jgi:hypothetical protein